MIKQKFLLCGDLKHYHHIIPYVFDKTNNKIAAVLSKYPNNLGGVAGDKTVGPIYQDVDVTPGSEVQLYFIGTSMGNTNGINGVKVSIYDSNNPTDLLYSGRPNTASKSLVCSQVFLMCLIMYRD